MPRSITAQPGDKCYLEALPAELRVEIYRYVLTGQTNIRLNSRFEEPGLLKVSKQIRNEAEPIFYGENTFDFPVQHWQLPRLQRFQRLLDRPNSNYGTDLRNNWLGERPHWTNFKQCLRKLHAEVSAPRERCT